MRDICLYKPRHSSNNKVQHFRILCNINTDGNRKYAVAKLFPLLWSCLKHSNLRGQTAMLEIHVPTVGKRRENKIQIGESVWWFHDLSKRSVRRPPARWTDDLKRVARNDWMVKTGDRVLWRTLGEAYVQQWTAMCDDDDDFMIFHKQYHSAVYS